MIENIQENKEFETEIVAEETKKTSKQNSVKRAKAPLQKECEVLVYNERNHTMIISFDGYGFEFQNVEKNPGKKVIIQYTGDINSSDFRMEYKGNV